MNVFLLSVFVVLCIAMWFRCTLSTKITLPICTCCTSMAGNGANGFKCASSSSQFALAYLNSTPTSSDDDDLQSSIAAATSTSSCFTTHSIDHISFDLDTIRVVETLRRLGTEPKLAFSFFHQVKRAGFQHNVSTYASLVAVLCSSGLDRMLDSVFLDLIAPSEEHHCRNAEARRAVEA